MYFAKSIDEEPYVLQIYTGSCKKCDRAFIFICHCIYTSNDESG